MTLHRSPTLLAILLLLLAGCGGTAAKLVTSKYPPNLGAACSHTALPDAASVERLGARQRRWDIPSRQVFAFRATVCNLGPAILVSGSPSHGLRYRVQFQHKGKPTFSVTADATGKRELFYQKSTKSAYKTTGHFWSLLSRATGLSTERLLHP